MDGQKYELKYNAKNDEFKFEDPNFNWVDIRLGNNQN